MSAKCQERPERAAAMMPDHVGGAQRDRSRHNDAEQCGGITRLRREGTVDSYSYDIVSELCAADSDNRREDPGAKAAATK